MDDLLGTAELRGLTKAKKELRFNQMVKRKSNLQWLKNVLAWCDENEVKLGKYDEQYTYITRDGITAVDTRFLQQYHSSISEVLENSAGNRRGLTSAYPDEKKARQFPTEHLVLSANLDLSMRISYQSLYKLSDTPPQVNIELDINLIDLSLFDYLIVVENRDCFNDWYDYHTTLPDNRILVIYRGNNNPHSAACIKLKKRWFDEKGTIGQVYFGDFDIDGLGIAIDSKTAYQHFLFPEIVTLNTLLITEHYDEDNVYRLRGLSKRCPEKWNVLLSLLLKTEKGLRQQWMFDEELVFYPTEND